MKNVEQISHIGVGIWSVARRGWHGSVVCLPRHPASATATGTGLQHLLDNNLLMDHATRNVIMNIVAQSGSEEARDELVRDVISVDQLHEIKS